MDATPADVVSRLAAEPLVFVAVWVVVAGILSSFPSRRHHWPLAYALMAAGAPILVWCWSEGPARGLAATLAAMLVLRWPLRYAIARLTGRPVR